MILVGSLFSGVGLFELGLLWALEEAGIAAHVAWQVEIDPFCRRVLARHYPDTDRSVVDVRAAHSLARVHIMLGGFPCQDVSGAGLGAGLDGERSGLWYEYLRIVREQRPRVVVVENVASGKRRYLCGVRRGLHDAGYATTALAIGAWEVGAPHRRERIFVVAHADGVRRVQPQGGEPVLRGRAPDGGPLADAHGSAERLEQGRRDGASGSDPAGALGRGPAGVGDPDGARSPVGGVERGDARSERASPAGAGLLGDASGSGREGTGGDRLRGPSRQDAAPESGRRLGQAVPGVGGGDDGGSAGVDRDPGRWPAGRGEEQHGWEPPRTVEGRQPHRRARLKALGNAVVPQQAREVGRWMIAQGLVPPEEQGAPQGHHSSEIATSSE